MLEGGAQSDREKSGLESDLGLQADPDDAAELLCAKEGLESTGSGFEIDPGIGAIGKETSAATGSEKTLSFDWSGVARGWSEDGTRSAL